MIKYLSYRLNVCLLPAADCGKAASLKFKTVMYHSDFYSGLNNIMLNGWQTFALN